MHEMSMVRVAVKAVLAECEGKGVTRVRSVHFAIGEMRDVVESYVPDLFRYLARGTVAADAQVIIERIPMRVRCRECGEIFAIDSRDSSSWRCPRCGAYQNYTLFSGSEFRIDSIEVECQGDQSLLGSTLVVAGSAA